MGSKIADRPDRPMIGAERGQAVTLTRFAPAPTGYLHLGHVANAIWVWGLSASDSGQVLLRIEDHDRTRCRPEYDAALVEDLDWLGFRADLGPVRQSDSDAPYLEALDRLRASGVVYACDCSRTTFRDWAETHGRPWTGAGCPGACRDRQAPEATIRVSLGGGSEAWEDRLAGSCEGVVAGAGDPVVRDRDGQWTYGFSVVVDDLRHGVDLVVRGRDLLDATPDQIRLGRLLGREAPPTFAHHRLILRPDGSKLSKADGATAVRELRDAGGSAAQVIGEAAAAVGLIDAPLEIEAKEIRSLVS
jgi:glutamyl/glutaminyl-tRNA synthetase